MLKCFGNIVEIWESIRHLCIHIRGVTGCSLYCKTGLNIIKGYSILQLASKESATTLTTTLICVLNLNLNIEYKSVNEYEICEQKNLLYIKSIYVSSTLNLI